MKITTKLFLFILLIISNEGYSQKKNEFGIVFQVENIAKYSEAVNIDATKATHTSWNVVFGGQYERLFSKHSSGGFGLKYRKAFNDIYIPIPVGSNMTDYVHFLITEDFLTFPIEYKYTFPFVSISVGTSVDYFLSWTQQRNFYGPLRSYDQFFDKKLSIGLLGSISKKILIDKNIVLEPTVYYNRMLSFERTYFGASLQIKYKF